MDILSRPAGEFENDQSIETLWAMKAYEHAEIYFNILCSVDPKYLKLTHSDDAIYNEFKNTFPNLNIKLLDEYDLKNTEAKSKWRNFCECFKSIEDYSFGTLLRLDCEKDYTDSNSTLVTRIQFYAIEIARNKEGLNDSLRSNYYDSSGGETKSNKT